mgnify:CR=1 FL=1
MVIQAILVGILYWLSMGRASYFISFAFRKPVVLGVFIGLVYGDVQTGLLYGATIQLMYMGGIEPAEIFQVIRDWQHVSQSLPLSQIIWIRLLPWLWLFHSGYLAF